VPLRKPHVKRTSTDTARISRTKSRKKIAKPTAKLGESACDPATLQAGIFLAIGPKIAKLVPRDSERDDRRHLIEMGRRFPHRGYRAMYELQGSQPMESIACLTG
jgi:hypothetical protein